MAKLICLELNEVPKEIMELCLSKLSLKDTYFSFKFDKTISYDKGHLHPWVTWSSVHRGVSHEKHLISDINQNCEIQNKVYPTIMDLLSKKGYKVGVFGSMHSGVVDPKNQKYYSFFVPECFSSHPICNPKTLIGLQKLNLFMSRSSARVVSQKLPNIILIIEALISYFRHVYKFRSFFCIFKQFVLEVFSPWKKIRRRILQSDILFDVYMHLLRKNNTDFSNFFTNHVASSMHRFWEAKFPNQYKKNLSSLKWINRYKNEIDIAMESSTYYINELIKYVDSQKDAQLWIISSMGQAAVQNYKKSSQFFQIVDMDKFLFSILKKRVKFEQLNQMIPIYALKSDENTINLISEKISSIISNVDIEISSKTSNTIAFIFNKNSHKIIYEEPFFKTSSKGKSYSFNGIKKVSVDENSGSSAYHVPEGILYRYGKNLPDFKKHYDLEGFLPIEELQDLMLKTIEKN